MTNSRDKGKRGENELSKELTYLGYPCHRGQQFCGANGDADVAGDIFDGVMHIECKRVEHLQLYNALAQAKSDARQGEIPLVMHRKNNSKWVVIMELDNFKPFLDSYYEMRVYDKEK